jgi:hypothetical protein
MPKYFCRAESTVTGETLMGGHYDAADAASARAMCETDFKKPFPLDEISKTMPDFVERYIRLQEQRDALIAQGYTITARRSKAA